MKLKMNFDKYLLLGISLFLIFLISAFINEEKITNQKEIGMIFDVFSSSNGYIFYFENSKSDIIKCFYSIKPEESKVYCIEGKYSKDGSIFFIESMDPYPLFD